MSSINSRQLTETENKTWNLIWKSGIKTERLWPKQVVSDDQLQLLLNQSVSHRIRVHHIVSYPTARKCFRGCGRNMENYNITVAANIHSNVTTVLFPQARFVLQNIYIHTSQKRSFSVKLLPFPYFRQGSSQPFLEHNFI